MDIYQGWFTLKDDVRDVDFADRFTAYMERLKADGAILGWRLMRRKLGLGPDFLHEFHFMVETDGLAQLDEAFRVVSTRAGEHEALHHCVNSCVEQVFFALYRDFPDPQRVRGEERF
ncbi:hypothetical protein KAJ83_11340 [Marivibrio halodurans]|uniref:Uncharacterized protein n=1 Tax=Marivibrio halodurans TaxID=2039722 RepID=A0A8J7V2W8_9PROT|nr:DUF6614 family protein [Marivibrio halodurans]MBP5857606.1 hypothetical protein [Marivibrio halodurans]